MKRVFLFSLFAFLCSLCAANGEALVKQEQIHAGILLERPTLEALMLFFNKGSQLERKVLS